MDELLLSIIIPVSMDIKIQKCLASIDEPVEIVVVLNNNPSQKVINIAKEYRCRCVFVKESGCNLARVFNLGIEVAKNEKILLMNSDCIFPQGLIRKIYNELDVFPVVKARVSFDYRSKVEYLVAECRRLFHHVFDDGQKFFGPGLSFRKEITRKINVFCNEKMQWGEDGDLSRRIHESGLPYSILEDNVIHCPEGVSHDLRIAFKIGRGNRIREKKLPFLEAFFIDLRHILTDHHKQFRIAYREGGLELLLYFFLWKIIFHLGYYSENFRR